jgi:hypothetical protein
VTDPKATSSVADRDSGRITESAPTKSPWTNAGGLPSALARAAARRDAGHEHLALPASLAAARRARAAAVDARLAAVLPLAGTVTVTGFDPVTKPAEFSPDNNPNGVWSYGYSPSTDGPSGSTTTYDTPVADDPLHQNQAHASAPFDTGQKEGESRKCQSIFATRDLILTAVLARNEGQTSGPATGLLFASGLSPHSPVVVARSGDDVSMPVQRSRRPFSFP